MSRKKVGLIIEQVKGRLHDIERAYELGAHEMADEQMSLLRDVLDEIYGRPEEDVKEGLSGGG